MSNEIVKANTNIIASMDDAERAARAMSASGFFSDARQAAQAVVKILAGQELGFGPFASMTGVHIIQGKPTLAANLMAAAVKRTGKYNYRVTEHTESVCEIAFFEAGHEVGKSRFTMDDAKKAGVTGNPSWQKYPRNMLFARAISNGQKWYAPDIFNGATVYTPEELGAEVDEEGNAIIDVKSEAVPQKTSGTLERPISPESLRAYMSKKIEKYKAEKVVVSPADGQIIAAVLDTTFNGEKTKRYELCKWLVGVASTKDMDGWQIKALQDWTECKTFDAAPPKYVISEAQAAHAQALKDSDQIEMSI